MAITVTLDTVEGAALEMGAQSRFARGGFVDGIDVSVSGNKSEALWLAGEAISAAAAAAPLEASRAGAPLSRIFLEPVSDTSAKARIIYESLTGGGPPSTYMIRDSSYMRSLTTNRMPGTHEPIVCTWEGLAYGSGMPVVNKISDRVEFTIMAPIRTIVVSALIYGRPTEDGEDKVFHVNHALWPTGDAALNPHAVGFWRVDKYETNFAKYSGYYTLEAQATTKIVEDWSETGTLRNAQTGRYVKVDPDDLTALLSPAYSYGITSGNGIVRVGFYPTTNYVSIFGF